MNGNPAFPTPPISMEALAAKIATFRDLVSEALECSRKVIAERNSVQAELISMLRQLAGYVGLVSEDEAIFLSSGFKMAPRTRKQAPPRTEGIRKITFGLNSGPLRLKAVSIPGSPVIKCAGLSGRSTARRSTMSGSRRISATRGSSCSSLV